MGLIRSLKKLLGAGEPEQLLPPPAPEPEEDEVDVPEVTVTELRAILDRATPPLLLDVREPYEWRQVRMADALHIPMNDVPGRLAGLPDAREIIVICAHGQRSYGVAYYLIEKGFRASSLSGGITMWAAQGGEVEM